MSTSLIREYQIPFILPESPCPQAFFILLRPLLFEHIRDKRSYQSNKRTLEAERIVAEREREEAKRIPRINYDDMIRCEPQVEGLDDISDLLRDDDEE